MTSPEPTTLDAFMCVHDRDIDYLFETSLRSLLTKFEPLGAVMLVTNDSVKLSDAVQEWGLGGRVSVSNDADWLSADEMALHGWFKQQLIKLRAYEFCQTENFCNLGADTVLLRPITVDDVVADGVPIVYYTQHLMPDLHWLYELGRVRNIGKILRVTPTRAARRVDYINDVFCFNSADLRGLTGYLTEFYGPDPYLTLLRGLQNNTRDQKKFGEWTLYTTYVLDVLKRDVTFRNTRDGFLYQVHSQRLLNSFGFDSKVAHFVGKDFDVDYVERRIAGIDGP